MFSASSSFQNFNFFPEFFRIRFLFKKSADRTVAFLRYFQQVQVSRILTFFLNFFRIRFLFKKSADRTVAFLQKSEFVFLQIFFFFTFSFLSTDTVTLKYFLFFFFSYIFFSFTFLLQFFLAWAEFFLFFESSVTSKNYSSPYLRAYACMHAR